MTMQLHQSSPSATLFSSSLSLLRPDTSISSEGLLQHCSPSRCRWCLCHGSRRRRAKTVTTISYWLLEGVWLLIVHLVSEQVRFIRIIRSLFLLTLELVEKTAAHYVLFATKVGSNQTANLIWLKFSTWRASIVLNWLSLYSNSYFVLFIYLQCMYDINLL